MNHIADNQDALLDYLYEEGDPAERLMIAKHLQECAACSVAVLEFQNVRGMLSDWTPPASQPLSAPVDYGARSGRSWGWGPTTTKESWRGWRPALQAAAAVLLFVSGMAVSQLNVDYRDGALTVRTPSAAPATPSAGIRNVSSIVLPAERASAGAAASNIDMNELERALRARLESQNASSVDTERLLQRVRAMIDQSEQRQQRELALRTAQIMRDFDSQRRVDLEQIQRNFGQIEGLTNAEVREQRQMLNYLMRVSQPQ
jgi:hypothetical protein